MEFKNARYRKDYNFDGTSVRQYLDNLDNVNNVYCN